MSRDHVGIVALALSLSVAACSDPNQDPVSVASSGRGLTAGQWTQVGNLADARNRPASEVLANGEVLVMGGFSSSGGLRSCEIYDPATQSFRATGSLVHPRSASATVALRDGRIVLFSPVSGTGIQQGEIFDPATESWSLIAAHPATVWASSATELLDGRVFVLSSGNFGQNGLYDPSTNTWQSAAANLQTQYTNDATLLSDGRVLISGEPVESEIYDPLTDTWAPAGILTTQRFIYTQTLLADGRVFVAGGRTHIGSGNFTYPTETEIYDPATNSWAAGPNLLGPRYAHSARRLSDGRVLIVGGFVEVAPGQSLSLATAEVFDPLSNTVSALSPLVGARGYPVLEVLANGDVLAAAGYGQGNLATAEVYVPLAGSPSDAGIADSGLHPDAAVLDSGLHPDATVLDSGLHADATVLDSGLHPDAGTAPSGLADLYIHDVRGSISNGNLSSEVVVCNRGSQPTSVGSVEVRLSFDEVFSGGDVLLHSATPSILVVGGSCVSTHIVNIAAPSFSGARRLVARVDATNTIAESDETNNSAAGASVRLTGALPNLVIESADYVEGDGQHRFNVDATVCNRGLAPSSQVGLFFTTSLSNPPGQPGAGGAQYPGLDPGACVRLRTGTNGFVSGGSRPDTLRLVVDATNAVAEDDETDNVWPVAFLVDQGQAPDLIVTRVDVPDAFVAPTRIVARVCNAGSLTSVPTNVSVHLSQSPQDPGPVGPWAVTTTLPVLDSKECADARFELDPTGLPFALTHIGVRIDPAGLVGDYAANNWFSAGWRWPQPTSPTPQPDLVVRTARMPTATNGTETADITVCNVGDAPSPGTELSIKATLVDLPERLTVDWQFINSLVAVPALRAGACAVTTSNVPLTAPGLATRLAVTVDVIGAITELDEGNNVWVSEPIAFGSGADLYVESGRAVFGTSAGISVEARICNKGYAAGTFSEVDLGFVGLDRLEYRVPNPGVMRQPVGPHVLAVNACVDLSLFSGVSVAAFEHFSIGIVGANDIDPRNDARRLSRSSIWSDFMDVQNLQVSRPVAPVGGVVDVSFDLCGRGGANPSQTLEFLLSRDDVRQAGDVVARTETVAQPGLDVCVPMTVPMTVPSVADGRYRIGLSLATDYVARFAAAADIVVGSGADYTAELVNSPSSAQRLLSAEVEICNHGDTNALDPVVHLLLSHDAHVAAPHLPTGSSDWSVGSATLPAPSAGQCNRGFVSGDVGPVPSGNYWIAAYVDWPNQIPEVREDNNVSAAHTLAVNPCGNSVLEPTEQCDDGNLIRGDGCDETCRVEVRAQQGEAVYTRGNNQRLTHAIADAAHPLNPTQALTFALWAREPRTSWETPANRWDSAGKVWSFSHNSNGVMAFTINDGSGSRNNYRAFATRPNGANDWTHYAMTYDQGVVHVYRNGVLDDGALSGTIPSSLSGGISDLHLGHWLYNGAMGNVMLVNRALNATEVADVYCALSDDPAQCSCGVDQHACSVSDVVNLPGLVSYWPLTSGPQDVVAGHHFVEQGTGWAYNDRTPVVVPVDAGVPDTGIAPDAGFVDTGIAPDAGFVDTGIAPDAGFVDTGIAPDAGFVDTGIAPDAGFVDTGIAPDAGMLDSGMLDAGGGPSSGVPAGRFPLFCQSVGVIQQPIPGSDPATSIFDGDLLTGFTPNYLDWLAVRCDFGRLRTVAAVRRAMARTPSLGITNRPYQGEQISLSPDAVTWTRLTEPTTTGWSGYSPTGTGLYTWVSVAYGWSNWLELNQPMSARYMQYYWDAQGPTEAMQEIEAFFLNECGNRLVEGFEQCDDGNLVRGDGCDEQCTVETPAQLGEVVYTRGNNQRLTHAIVDPAHPLNPSQAFTFSLWAREPRTSWETPANRWDSTGKVWSFSHNSNGVMAIAINDGSGSRGNYRPFATSPDGSNSWTHYTMTYDQGALHVYRNGVLDDGPLAGTIPISLSGGVSDLHLGHWLYNGAMGNVAFFDRALSPQEASDVYCSLSPSATPCVCGVDGHVCSESDLLYMPGLVSYWPMTSGPQDVVGGYDFVEQGSGWSYGVRP